MPTPTESNKTKLPGNPAQTVVERKNGSNQRNQGPDGDASPLKNSMDNIPVITKDQRKTGRIG